MHRMTRGMAAPLMAAVVLSATLAACTEKNDPAPTYSTPKAPEVTEAPQEVIEEPLAVESPTGPDWESFIDPVGAITQAEANDWWDGHSLVQGPPYDIRGLELVCYRYDYSFDLYSFGNWVWQGSVIVDADGTYTWLDLPGGTVAPSGIGAQLVFTGAWDNPGNSYIAIPDKDGDPRLIAALATDVIDDFVFWYCS